MEINKEIIKLLAQVSVIYGKSEPLERLECYARELGVYEPKLVEASLRRHVKTSKFFPSLAEIVEGIANIKTPQIDATQAAQTLINATYRFGEYRREDAKEELGEDLWHIVERWGGWLRLCKFSDDQIPTMRAQLRDLIEDINRKSKFRVATVGLPQIEQKNELKALDFSGIFN